LCFAKLLTGNRRGLIWKERPRANGEPADLLLGQTSKTGRNENGSHDPDASLMCWPYGLACWSGGLAVADVGNNWIMLWRSFPESDGQPDAQQTDHNQKRSWPDALALNMDYGLAARGDLLMTADNANSRLLGGRAPAALDGEAALETSAAASHLTGQTRFSAKGDNRWQPPVRDSLCCSYLCCSYGLTLCGTTAVVADSENNRVVLWDLAP